MSFMRWVQKKRRGSGKHHSGTCKDVEEGLGVQDVGKVEKGGREQANKVVSLYCLRSSVSQRFTQSRN